MPNPKTNLSAEALESWLTAELQGDLLTYLVVDTGSWARNLAARMRAAGHRLPDRTYRELRTMVEDYARTRLEALRDDARARIEADTQKLPRTVGPEFVSAAISNEAQSLALDLREVTKGWTDRVLSVLKKRQPDLKAEAGRDVAALVAARGAMCWGWALEARNWTEHQARTGLATNHLHKRNEMEPRA